MKKVLFLIAIISINLIIGCGPSGKEHYDKGKASLYAEDCETAIKEFNKAIEIEPDNAEYYFFRGLAHKDNKSYEAAKKDFNKALELDYSEKALVYMYRGLVKSHLDDDTGAVSDYDKSIEIDPKSNAEAYYYRAISKSYIAEDYDDEINDYTKAIEIDPDFRMAYYNRGIVKNNSEDFEGAIKDLDIAIQKGYKFAYAERGFSKFMLDQYEEALEDFNTMVTSDFPDHDLFELHSTLQDVYFFMGLSNLFIDELDEACFAFEMAKDLGYEDAEEYLNEYCQ